MSDSRRYEWRVGVFVLVGLTLLGVLMLQFSKGWDLLTPTYPLTLKTANVGGIKRGAGVLMAGVPIGSVVTTDLDGDGKSVNIQVKIFKRYPIRQDAQFQLEQSGFLGDQYVSVLPQSNQAPLLQAGDGVVCKEPFNLQDAARAAVGLMQQLDRAAATLDTGMRRVDRILLTEQNLTNVTVLVAQLRAVSEKATGTMAKLDQIVEASAAPVGLTLTNLVRVSARWDALTSELQGLVATNRDTLQTAFRQLESSATRVNALLSELQAGKGLAGSLLKNEQLDRQFLELVGNLTLVSSNLNKYGLLYKPKPVRTSPLPDQPGKPYSR